MINNDTTEIKANSLKDLHSIAVDIMSLFEKFKEKYPSFEAAIIINHKDLRIILQIKKIGDE